MQQQIAISVIDNPFRLSQKRRMWDHDALRDELTRRLDSRALKGKDVASRLNVGTARITEIKKGKRKLQPREMPIVAEILGLNGAAHVPPQPWLPKPETLADLLAAAMHVDAADAEKRGELLDYASAVHTGLEWIATDPASEDDPGFLKAVRLRVAESIASGRIAPSQAS